MRIRKIFSTRSQIPCENLGEAALQLQEAVPEVESLPRNLDFNPSANALNQLINHETVCVYILQNIQGGGTSIEDSMVITGLQI